MIQVLQTLFNLFEFLERDGVGITSRLGRARGCLDGAVAAAPMRCSLQRTRPQMELADSVDCDVVGVNRCWHWNRTGCIFSHFKFGFFSWLLLL